MRIGELAKRSDCPVETIRYYERERLLPKPRRTSGNYRLYGAEHVARLAFVRRCRSTISIDCTTSGSLRWQPAMASRTASVKG